MCITATQAERGGSGPGARAGRTSPMSRRPDVTLTQLRYFVRAATHGSMTQAAGDLRVAQSAVSAAVAQLERQVGTQLFIRQRARGLVLTAAGEEVRGSIRVACFVTLAPFVLPELLADLADHHPGIEVEVIETEAGSLGAA